MLGKFNSEKLAKSFSYRTRKISRVILGDDGKYWVVNMATLNRLEKAGYQVLPW